MTEPKVVFNMDLANAPTGERFCHEAAAVLGIEDDVTENLNNEEELSELVDEWTSQLESNGYYVWWNAGDVVVWDLRPLTDDERDEFIEEMCDR